MATARRLVVLALLALPFLAAPSGALAGKGTGSIGDQIVLSGTVIVPRGQTVDEVVVLRGRAVILGVALGDVVVLDGPIVVQGQVSGSVVAVNGPVSIGPNAQIRGDVLASGAVRIEEGAKVNGVMRQHAAFTWRAATRAVGRFATWLAVSVSLLVLGLLMVLVTPRGMDAAFEAFRTGPWASLGWGLAVAIGLPVLAVAAIATLIGLPLGLGILLALALVYSIGYALAAWAIGRLLWRPPRSRAVAFLLGWVVLRSLALIPYVGSVTWAVGAVYGLGTLSVATWRARPARGKHRERRAVPPEMAPLEPEPEPVTVPEPRSVPPAEDIQVREEMGL